MFDNSAFDVITCSESCCDIPEKNLTNNFGLDGYQTYKSDRTWLDWSQNQLFLCLGAFLSKIR